MSSPVQPSEFVNKSVHEIIDFIESNPDKYDPRYKIFIGNVDQVIDPEDCCEERHALVTYMDGSE